jgi:hypothetical protein
MNNTHKTKRGVKASFVQWKVSFPGVASIQFMANAPGCI